MNSAEYLLPEDQAEFERVLDEVLRTAHHYPQLGAGEEGLPVAELRAMALGAMPLITSRAAEEYGHYVGLRQRLRRPERPADGGLADADGAADSAVPRREGSGAGLVAVVSVLLPILAGVAAVIFLLVGYGLGLSDPAPAVAEPMRTVGWVFAGLAALGALIAAVELIITAVRNDPAAVGPQPGPAGPGELADEVDRARAEWRRALLNRGLLPFLRDTLEERREAKGGVETAPEHRVPQSRTPRLRFSSPDFSSPTEGREDRGGSRYAAPDFSSPSFGSPAEGGSDRE